MKEALISLAILLFTATATKAQPADSAGIIRLNQQIDSHVIAQDLAALDTLYADDFVFSHGSGLVEGKGGWLKTVSTVRYSLRQHDSVTAELHAGIIIVKGKLSVQRTNKDKTSRYNLKYIRVYVLRNKRWQLLSHHTVYEHDEP
jgi:ketosteroid isomerase-like protein